MSKGAMSLVTTIVLGAMLGATALLLLHDAPAGQSMVSTKELAALRAEIELLKGKAPDQAHAMQDVGQHFANLWFAGQNENWELARFNWSETRSHLRWAVRIIPKRKDSADREIDLEAILQAFENTPLAALDHAITARDREAFEAAYNTTLEGCYACHKAAEKPFLRPQIPESPASPILNFEPKAEWPR